MEYYYEIDGKKNGPSTREEIQGFIDNQKLNRESLIWCSSFSDWKPISEADFDLSKLQPPPLKGDAIDNKYLWILGFAPLIGTFIEYLFAYATTNSSEEAELNMANSQYWLIGFGFNILISLLDERSLNRAGHDTTKFKGWVWLIPVYMYVRSNKTKVTLVPFIIWIACLLLVIFA